MVKKKESGHQGRKRRRAAAVRALEEQGARAADGELPRALERLAAIGPPPTLTTKLLPWTAAIVAEALHQAAIDPKIDEDRRRAQIAALADRLGKLYPRAELEAGLSRLESLLKERRTNAIVTVAHGSTIKRPPTARGMGLPGPRALTPDATDDDLPPPGVA